MDDYVKPVIKEKPMRGREMKTNIIPADVFDTMKLVSAKKTLKQQSLVPELEEPSTKKTELYHEGYVDGKLYLVPDSNLDAMKDMISFKMKPVAWSGSKLNLGSYDISDYELSQHKLRTTMEKLDNIDTETEEGEEEMENEEEEDEDEEMEEFEVEKEENNVEKEEEVVEKEEEKKVEEEEEEEDEEDEEDEDDEEKMTEKIKENEVPPLKQEDPNCLRFLISGHFRKDQKPIYIIQDYRGGLDLFSEQKAVFCTKQKEDDIDFTMTGRFFNKRILEESEGKPKALNIKPHKILIDEKSSTVHDEYFEQVYKFNSVNVTLKGEFIKSRITKRTTPFLTLAVKHKNQRKSYKTRKSPTAVLICKPEHDHPFTKLHEKYNSLPIIDDQEFISNALVIQSSIIGLSPYSQNKDEQRSFKHMDEGKVGDKQYKDKENYECDLESLVSMKLYEIDTNNKLTNMFDDNMHIEE